MNCRGLEIYCVTEEIPSEHYDGNALSIGIIEHSGYYTFSVPVDVRGVVVGLTQTANTRDFYDISHGVHFQSGMFRIMENGQDLTELQVYAATDVWFVLRIAGQTHILRDDGAGPYSTTIRGVDIPASLVYSSVVLTQADGVVLKAALLGGRDTVVVEAGPVIVAEGGVGLAYEAWGVPFAVPHTSVGKISRAWYGGSLGYGAVRFGWSASGAGTEDSYGSGGLGWSGGGQPNGGTAGLAWFAFGGNTGNEGVVQLGWTGGGQADGGTAGLAWNVPTSSDGVVQLGWQGWGNSVATVPILTWDGGVPGGVQPSATLGIWELDTRRAFPTSPPGTLGVWFAGSNLGNLSLGRANLYWGGEGAGATNLGHVELYWRGLGVGAFDLANYGQIELPGLDVVGQAQELDELFFRLFPVSVSVAFFDFSIAETVSVSQVAISVETQSLQFVCNVSLVENPVVVSASIVGLTNSVDLPCQEVAVTASVVEASLGAVAGVGVEVYAQALGFGALASVPVRQIEVTTSEFDNSLSASIAPIAIATTESQFGFTYSTAVAAGSIDVIAPAFVISSMADFPAIAIETNAGTIEISAQAGFSSASVAAATGTLDFHCGITVSETAVNVLPEALYFAFVLEGENANVASLAQQLELHFSVQVAPQDIHVVPGRFVLLENQTNVFVFNLTTLGVSTYDGTLWNEAQAGAANTDSVFIVSPDGLYAQAGDSDAGADIDAYIQTGDHVFGDMHRLKYCPKMWLYGRAEHGVLARTLINKAGSRMEYDYSAPQFGWEETGSHWVHLGRGVRSVTWAYRLQNVAGGALDVRGVSVELLLAKTAKTAR